MCGTRDKSPVLNVRVIAILWFAFYLCPTHFLSVHHCPSQKRQEINPMDMENENGYGATQILTLYLSLICSDPASSTTTRL